MVEGERERVVEDERVLRLEEEREALEDERLLPIDGLDREGEELDPILLRLDDIVPTLVREELGVERWLRVAPTRVLELDEGVRLLLRVPSVAPLALLDDGRRTRLDVRGCGVTRGLGLRVVVGAAREPIRLLRLDEVAPTVGRDELGEEGRLVAVPVLPRRGCGLTRLCVRVGNLVLAEGAAVLRELDPVAGDVPRRDLLADVVPVVGRVREFPIPTLEVDRDW